MRRWSIVALVVAVVLIFSLGPLAQTGARLDPVSIPGLKAPVRVVTDKFGVPHVFAQSASDLYRVVGWLHARDRLFQMDVLRRTASGTLAELFGERVLGQDTILRLFGLRRAAELTEKIIPNDAREEMNAYVTGVNAYINTINQSGQLPPEYKELELSKVASWSGLDSLAIGKLLTFDLSFNIDASNVLTYFKYRAVGTEKGFNGHALFFEDLFRSAPADPAVVVRDAEGRLEVRPPTADLPEVSPTVLAMLEKFYQRIKDIDFFKSILNREALMETGSNWWLIGSKHSATGYALLANDPHLGLEMPGVWYAIDQKSADGINVVGTTFPGIPYVILGHNEKIAWSATVNPLDETDMFQEAVVERDGKLFSNFQGKLEPVTALEESYRVNKLGDGQFDNLAEAPKTTTYIIPRHGPVVSLDLKIGQAISVQYTGFYATTELLTFRLWNRARNLEQFREGVKFFDVGSQNWGYADVEGNIAYFTGAEAPLRQDLEAGRVDLGLPPFFVRDGTGSALHQWISMEGGRAPGHATPSAILPIEEMPQIVNPPAGFIVSANNDPLGTTLDNDPLNQRRRGSNAIYYLDWSYDIGFRAGRITELIKAKIAKGEKFSVEDMAKIQSDTVSLIGRRLTASLLTALKNARSADAPDELKALLRDTRLADAIEKYIAKWSFATPTGIPEGFDENDSVSPDGKSFTLNTPSESEITDSVATTIFNVWLSVFIRRVIDDTLDRLDKTMAKPGGFFAVNALLNLLERFPRKQGRGESGVDFFDVPDLFLSPEEERDWRILKSLQDALDLLRGDAFAKAYNKSEKLEDYRWGKLHRITFRSSMHPQTHKFSIPPAVYPQPEYADGLPVDGTLAAVDVANYSVKGTKAEDFGFSRGPSQRQIVELNPKGIRAWNALPTGQSGVANTSHFGDLIAYWLVNDYYPVLFTDDAIKANAESEQEFRGN
ncbi:penicillin acylase family protein [Candidatus Acetothermia bacterium]|jgi:penicillin amidase|nr:penicillin acylase family protein [Candidatus Acetothermia bacterium]MCI2431217.1 penicillin acylase family protein [Candidatus Acetothermia bacterium]MCI2436830.1 penicillin acylase family protein [Candidatus Acetothermia bacterium]